MDILFQPAFALLVLLLTKHFVYDFLFQNAFMLVGKGKYGHLGGIVHAGLHALSSFFILYLFVGDWQKVAWIAALEFAIHYHIDWLKIKYNSIRQLNPSQSEFWWITGLDQWLHHMTYVFMVVLALAK